MSRVTLPSSLPTPHLPRGNLESPWMLSLLLQGGPYYQCLPMMQLGPWGLGQWANEPLWAKGSFCIQMETICLHHRWVNGGQEKKNYLSRVPQQMKTKPEVNPQISRLSFPWQSRGRSSYSSSFKEEEFFLNQAPKTSLQATCQDPGLHIRY